MKIVPKIFNIVIKIAGIFSIVVISVFSLVTAYIIYAPNEFPKPFRLVYDYSTPSTMVQFSNVTPTPLPKIYNPGEGVMANMSTKIINLADASGRKYIRVTMVLEFAPDDPKYEEMKPEEKTAYLEELTGRISNLMPLMDDTVITLLSTKTFDELYPASGKELLRLEILKAIAAKVSSPQIISVYFTEFVVQ